VCVYIYVCIYVCDVYGCWIGGEMGKEGHNQRENAHGQEIKKARVERFREWCEIEEG